MIQPGLGIRALMWSDAEVPGRVIPAEMMMMIMHVSHGHVHGLDIRMCAHILVHTVGLGDVMYEAST